MGTVFQITAAGQESTLYSFGGVDYRGDFDGATPKAGLVQGRDGSFYGTTSAGGTGNCSVGCGTVFKLTLNGN